MTKIKYTDCVSELLQVCQLLMVCALLHPSLHHLHLVITTVILLLQLTMPNHRDK